VCCGRSGIESDVRPIVNHLTKLGIIFTVPNARPTAHTRDWEQNRHLRF
jgi:hypothetical protein